MLAMAAGAKCRLCGSMSNDIPLRWQSGLGTMCKDFVKSTAIRRHRHLFPVGTSTPNKHIFALSSLDSLELGFYAL